MDLTVETDYIEDTPERQRARREFILAHGAELAMKFSDLWVLNVGDATQKGAARGEP